MSSNCPGNTPVPTLPKHPELQVLLVVMKEMLDGAQDDALFRHFNDFAARLQVACTLGVIPAEPVTEEVDFTPDPEETP